jgi:Ca2+-binding RTX toxin-like protein
LRGLRSSQLATAAAAVAIAAAPAAATASTARIGPYPDSILQPAPDALIVVGGAESNSIGVTENGADTIVTDSAGIAPADATCQALSPTSVECSHAGPSLLYDLRLGGGDDNATVTLGGGFSFGRILGGEGNDRLRVDGDASVEADGGAGDDVIAGGAHADRLSGGDGSDRLGGGGRDDRLDGGAGPDVLVGGDGRDVFDYSARTVPVSVTIDGNANDGSAGERDLVLGSGDDIEGGSAGDFLAGDPLANRIRSGGGNDVVFGGGGADELSLAAGNDHGDGGEGNDVVDGGVGADRILGGAGDDRLHAGGRPDEPDGSADRVEGGPGIDTYDALYFDPSCVVAPGPFCEITRGAVISLDDVANDNGEGDDIRSDVETVVGSGIADIIVGNAGANAILGEGGDDRIAGGGGGDLLLGQTGNDRIDSRDGALDAIDCGPGTDFLLADPGDIVQGCETVSRP